MHPSPRSVCRNEVSEHYHWGQKAANDLNAFIARRPVECVEVDRDQYKRAVAVCSVAGVDLAEWLVKKTAWRSTGRDIRLAITHQEDGKRAERGMWSGSFC
jgi:endonuclease YncB( thermonuclease family)